MGRSMVCIERCAHGFHAWRRSIWRKYSPRILAYLKVDTKAAAHFPIVITAAMLIAITISVSRIVHGVQM